MFGSLVEMREGLEALAGAFDPAVLTAEQAEAAVDHAVAIKHMAATIEALAVARVAETNRWRAAGDRSAAEWLARRSGASRARSEDVVRTGRRLRRLDDAGAAARRGALSPAQATEIADAAAVAPDAEAALVDLAQRGASLGELRDEARRRRATADPNPEATRQRIHRHRQVRRFTDSEGGYNLHLRHTVDAGAHLDAALQPLIDQAFRQARSEGREESLDAYAADALLELARRSLHLTPDGGGPQAGAGDDAAAPSGEATDSGEADRTVGASGTGPTGASAAGAAEGVAAAPGARTDTPVKPPKFLGLLRVDVAALQRGHAEDGELVEIAGVGPIPVATARDLLGDAVLKLVITRGVDVLNVTHLGRGPTAAQRTALLWTDRFCRRLGCSRTRRLQADHRTPWADRQQTRLDNLDGLCPADHNLKTHHGWALVAGTGRRPMVPSDHPDHPGNARAPARSGPEPPADTAPATRTGGPSRASPPPTRQPAFAFANGVSGATGDVDGT